MSAVTDSDENIKQPISLSTLDLPDLLSNISGVLDSDHYVMQPTSLSTPSLQDDPAPGEEQMKRSREVTYKEQMMRPSISGEWEAIVARYPTPLIPRRPDKCKLCLRIGQQITAHHLIPQEIYRAKGYTKVDGKVRTAKICRPCHNIIHLVMSNKDMAANHYTIELLVAYPEVQNWVEWNAQVTDEAFQAMLKPAPYIPKDEEDAAELSRKRKRSNTRATTLEPLLPEIKRALELIWLEKAPDEEFPRVGSSVVDGDQPEEFDSRYSKMCGTPLRKRLREIVQSNAVQKLEIKRVMANEPEWEEWYSWVWGIRRTLPSKQIARQLKLKRRRLSEDQEVAGEDGYEEEGEDSDDEDGYPDGFDENGYMEELV